MPAPFPVKEIPLIQRLLEGQDGTIPARLIEDCQIHLGGDLDRLYTVLDRNRSTNHGETIRINIPEARPNISINPMAVAVVGYKKILNTIRDPDISAIENQDEAVLVPCPNNVVVGIVSDTASTSHSSAGSELLIKEVGLWLSGLPQFPHYNDRTEFKYFAQSLCRKVRRVMYDHARDFKGADESELLSDFAQFTADFSCTLNLAIHYPDGKAFKFFFGNGYSFDNFDCDFFGQRDDSSATQPFPVMAILCNPYVKAELDMKEAPEMYRRSLVPAIFICDSNQDSIISSDGAKDTDLSIHEKALDLEYRYFPLRKLIENGTPAKSIEESILLYHLLCLSEQVQAEPALKSNPRTVVIAQSLLDKLRKDNPATYKNFPDYTENPFDIVTSIVKLKLKFISYDAFGELIDQLEHHRVSLHPINDDLGFTFMPAKKL